jgi:hypothetical protein
MKSRSIRTFAVLASAGLIVGAFAAGPADAAKKKKKKVPFACAPVTATAPSAGHSANASEAEAAEVVNVTSAATEDAPIVIEYEHGPALSDAGAEDTKYFAFQVVSKTAGPGLYIKQEWDGVYSDIDMYMSDASGAEVAVSGAYNPAPIPGVTDAGGNGGQGFESIPGFPAAPCSPYTIESKAYATPGEAMTLSVWLGEADGT